MRSALFIDTSVNIRNNISINKSQYAILGVLSLTSQSGYEIKKKIDQGIGHFWNESYGQIYPILKQLVDLEYANVQHLIKQRDHMLEALETYKEIEGYLTKELSSNPDYTYWVISLRQGLLTAEAKIKWCEESITLLKEAVQQT